MSHAVTHFGIAEAGKVCALAGDHREALRHYREAMGMAERAGAQPVFQRHYLECALESLEALGALDEVLQTCEAAIRHYTETPPQGDLATADLAAFLQRKGVILLKQGRSIEARESLQRALAVQRLPLAEQLLGWVARGYRIDAERLRREQERLGYFVVTSSTVRRERAVPLPGATPVI